MNEDLNDVWLVTYEMFLRHDFEKILDDYIGHLATRDTCNYLYQEINDTYLSAFPNKWEIFLDGEMYVLDSFSVSLESSEVNISPNFTIKNMFNFNG